MPCNPPSLVIRATQDGEVGADEKHLLTLKGWHYLWIRHNQALGSWVMLPYAESPQASE